MLMQTDNEDGPQTHPHQHRGPQTSHRSAGGSGPPRVTLSPLGLPGPMASGSPTAPQSGRTPPALPTLGARVGGRQPEHRSLL